ncbi:MAG: transcription antitermination factor NusB [Lautropia sp.]|nr:transcription antitermination factor NusB [Lautropia sp.]
MQGHSPAAATGHRTRSARRRSREFAMQGIYQWLLSGEDVGAIQAHIEASPGFELADRSHFETLLKGAIGKSAELDNALLPSLDRPLNQLSPVERAILMLATFELMNLQEIPYRVVINEAVELAKNFGGTDGYKYVNGVLDRIAPAIRTTEARPQKAG